MLDGDTVEERGFERAEAGQAFRRASFFDLVRVGEHAAIFADSSAHERRHVEQAHRAAGAQSQPGHERQYGLRLLTGIERDQGRFHMKKRG